MSFEFRCLDRKGKVQLALEASAKATGVSGNGTPGLFISIPKGSSFIPANEFCGLIRYFLTNYDLTKDDPRLKLLADMKKARKVEGWNGKKSRILDLPWPGERRHG